MEKHQNLKILSNTTKHTYTDKTIHFPDRGVVAEISCQLHILLQETLNNSPPPPPIQLKIVRTLILIIFANFTFLDI